MISLRTPRIAVSLALALPLLFPLGPGCMAAQPTEAVPAVPPAGASASNPVVAQRGDVTLTANDVHAFLDHLDPAVREKVLHDPATLAELVRAQLMQSVLLAEAKAKKWDQTPDVEYRANQARDTAITQSYLASVSQPDASYPTDADIQAAYEANKPRFVVPRQYHVAQIYIAVPAGAARAVDDDAQKKLRDIRAQALKPRADFADLARRSSQDRATAPHGGDLGWVREDQLAPQIKEAVAGLQEGGLSDPVRLPDGWHLLKLVGTRPASTAPLSDVKDELVKALRQQRISQNARTYTDTLLRTQPIQLDEIQLSHLTK